MSDFPVPAVSLIDNRPATTSLAIAEHFGKNHKEALRDIRTLIDQCPEDFHGRNFALMSRKVKIGNGAERDDPFYHVFFDGFILLVMGYTGPKALKMKLAYIGAFNAMREKLEGKTIEETAAERLSAADCEIIISLVKSITDRYEPLAQRSVNMRVWRALRKQFGVASYKLLPKSKMPEIVYWLANYEHAAKPIPEGKKQTRQGAQIDPAMSKTHQQVLAEVYDMSQNCGRLINQISGNLQNSVMHYATSEQKQRMFYTLQYLRRASTDALYMAQNSLIAAWNLGRGVSFV